MNIGRDLLRGITTGLFGIFKALGQLTLLTSKMALLGLAVGAVGAAIAGLGGAIVNLMPWISQLVTTAIAAAGALLLIPGAIATVITAVATLKLGLKGVGEALKAGLTGDLEAFNKALEKLAPNAAEFVREVIKIKPAFDRVRLSIQNSLFADLADMLRRLAEAYLPVLNDELSVMASRINLAFRGIGEFLLGAQSQADIAAIFQAAAASVGNFAEALVPALQILRDVAVVATQVISNLSGGLLPIIQGWADTIARMRADGSLEKLILDGLEALKQFAHLAGDLLGILTGLFKAAGGAEGGGLFGFFDRLNHLVNSMSGQNALVEIFTALGDAAEALAPVLVVLLQALVPILQGLSEIAIAFAPGLLIVVQALGPALASLVPGFIALAPLLSVLAESFAPLAQILVDLVVNVAPYLTEFFRLLSDLLAELAPVAAPLGQAIGLLVLAFADLIALFGPLIADGLKLLAEILVAILVPLEPLARQMLPLFTRFMHELFNVLQPLIPAFSDLAFTLVDLFIQHMPEILTTFEQLTTLFILFAQMITGEVVQAIGDLIPMLPQLVTDGLLLTQAFIKLMTALMPLIPVFINLLQPLLTNRAFLDAVVSSIQVLTIWLLIMADYINIVVAGVRIWISFLSDGIEGIKKFIGAVRDFFTEVGSTFRDVGSTIMGALGNLAGMLYDAGRNAIQGLINGVKSMFGPVSNAMSSLATMVRNFWPFSPAKTGPLSGRGDMLIAGQSLVNRLVQGVQSEMDAAAAASGALAGLFGMGGPGAFAFAGGPGGGGSAQPQPLYVMVQIGDKPVREMVQAEIVDNPGVVAAATDEGHRQNAGNTGRKRIGDT